jgi:hypothetical protein
MVERETPIVGTCTRQVTAASEAAPENAETRGPHRARLRGGVQMRGPHHARLRGGVQMRGPHRARLRGGVQMRRIAVRLAPEAPRRDGLQSRPSSRTALGELGELGV